MSSRVLKEVNKILNEVHPSILWPSALLIGIAILTWFYTRMARGNFDFGKYKKIPGKRPLPILGNALDVGGEHTGFIKVKDTNFVYLKPLKFWFSDWRKWRTIMVQWWDLHLLTDPMFCWPVPKDSKRSWAATVTSTKAQIIDSCILGWALDCWQAQGKNGFAGNYRE